MQCKFNSSARESANICYNSQKSIYLMFLKVQTIIIINLLLLILLPFLLNNRILLLSDFLDVCHILNDAFFYRYILHLFLVIYLSPQICAYSKEWVDHLAATDTFKHRTQDRKYGENIFMKWSSDPNHTIQGKINKPLKLLNLYTKSNKHLCKCTGNFSIEEKNS